VALTEGETLTLDISTNLPLSDLIFESYDSEVATLQGSIVQGLSAGEVLVVVRSKTGEVSDSLIVTVNARPVVEDNAFDLTIDGERVSYDTPIRLSELTEPTQEGSRFLGWRVVGTDEVLDADTILDADTNLESVFEINVEPVAPEPEPEPEPEVPVDTEPEPDPEPDPEPILNSLPCTR